MSKADDTFDKQVKATFDESVDKLDAATLSRLNRSRHEALAELQRPGRQWSHWMPATGVVAAVLVAVMMLQRPTAVDDFPAASNVTDREIRLGEDSIEMLEDLEFYSWIDAADMDSDVG